MKKRIFTYMCASVLLLAALLTILWSALLERQFQAQFREGLKTQRISIIGEDGTVEFDNAADASSLDNHLNRPEVAQALKNGTGSGERFSDTLGQKTYYYAQRMPDSRVLRISFTANTVTALLEDAAPLFMLCLVAALAAALALASRLTRRIVEPLATFDLESSRNMPYDELAPFLNRIEKQKSEIEHSTAELLRRANTIKAVNDNMKEGLLLLDCDGAVLSANPAAMAILGAGEELVGKSILYAYRDIVMIDKVKQCLQGAKSSHSVERGGRVYDVYLRPVVEGGECRGALMFFMDVTDKSLAEKQRKEFSANVSHELKTPLTTISALAEMISGGIAKPEDISGFGQKIGAQAKRMIAMIEDILRLSQFDEGGPIGETEPFDPLELAEGVAANLLDKARERGVSIRATGERFILNASRHMIDELMFNLLDNAIMYNKDGGEAELNVSNKDGVCIISVRDTGIGIPKDQQGRVFERFYRVDKSRSQKTGGTGLGLSIVKHIAERHGGYARIESEPGVGTTIFCSIRNQKAGGKA